MLNVYQLERHITEVMQSARIPGLALALIKDLEIIYARGFGVSSIEDENSQVTPQTLFRIGSMTKPLTATAVMRLVEAGKLDLDRPIKAYLDWLKFSDQEAGERITLRMLLTHTSGLPTDAEHFGSRDPGALETYVRQEVPAYPLVAQPGENWSYSNVGFNLAGYLAEVVSGQPFSTLMQDLVFDPLEMTRTTFDPTVAMTYSLAQSHDLDQDGRLHVQHRFADNAAHNPGGFALSTVLDLAHFAIMHLNEGCFHDKQFLSPTSIAEMHAPHHAFDSTPGVGYGLSFGIVSYKGRHILEKYGAISTFESWFMLILEAGAALIMLNNRRASEQIVEECVHSLLDQLLDLQ